jgi:hypothetical protein
VLGFVSNSRGRRRPIRGRGDQPFLFGRNAHGVHGDHPQGKCFGQSKLRSDNFENCEQLVGTVVVEKEVLKRNPTKLPHMGEHESHLFDVEIERLCLIWTPWSVDEDGIAEACFDSPEI